MRGRPPDHLRRGIDYAVDALPYGQKQYVRELDAQWEQWQMTVGFALVRSPEQESRPRAGRKLISALGRMASLEMFR